MSTVDILGIDLGTTKSVIAAWDPTTERPFVLANAEGKTTTPSVVAFDQANGESIPVVGEPAVQRMLVDPTNVAYSVKRLIGRPPEDKWVAYDQERMTYQIDRDPESKVLVHIGGQDYTPSQISAEVLRKLKHDASTHLDTPVTQAIISVPAYFNESQRRATNLAGELAELIVARIIPEPTAAALAFGLGMEPANVAVYDLGGGTFDISILEIKPGLFKVRAIGGDTHLGGDDFDAAIVEWLAQAFAEQHDGHQLALDNELVRARLREEAKRAKVALTDALEVSIDIPGLPAEEGQKLDLNTILSREAFEELINPKIQETLDHVEKTLKTVKMQPEDIDEILLVGGQTRTPAVQNALSAKFGIPLNNSVEPDQAVALGAAVLGARLCGYMKDRIALWDAIPLSLGVELADGRMDVIIPANEKLPIDVWRRGPRGFTTQKDNQSSIRFTVWQGERPAAADNSYVGEVILPLATARRAGEYRVECLFKVDINGILTVRAESADSEGKPAEMTFTPGAISPAEIAAARKAAEQNRLEDERRRQLFALTDEIAELRDICSGRASNDPMWQLLAESEAAVSAHDVELAVELVSRARQQLE